MSQGGFAELAARSYYSFLEGSASSPQQLVEAAAACGIEALGLCDRNGLYGAVAFTQAAERAGVRAVLGAELDLVDGSRLRLLARDRTGYRQLARAISAAQLAGEKGQPLLRLAGVTEDDGADPAPPRRARDLLPPPERPPALRPTAGPFPSGWPALPGTRVRAGGPAAEVDPGDLSHCFAVAGGPHASVTRALVAGDRRGALRIAERLRECFGRDRVALLLTHHLHPGDSWLAAETAALARRSGLPVVVSSTPSHASAGDKPLLDVLTAVRHRCTLDEAAAHGLLLANAEHRIRGEAELRALLGAYPEAFDHTAHIARQCAVSLDFSDVRFPGFEVPDGETPFSMLYGLCQRALPQRYQPITQRVAARLQRELDVIERTGLAEFFLICWDLMRHAREHGIPGQGRGSAADSIVAYLLGITRVDPVEHDLLFERFLHEDHQGTPDIDIDFSTDHREQILQYVYDRYGWERTGMVANVITYRPKLAVRDVGAALGFPETVIDRIAKSVDGYYWDGFADAMVAEGAAGGHWREAELRREIAEREAPGFDRHRSHPPGVNTAPVAAAPGAPLPWRHFLDMVGAVIGIPRHLGIHVGGMLVTGEPLVDVAPVERATMPGRVVVQFNKDDVEDLGLIKMDMLGLRTLSAVAECLDLVHAATGERPDLDALPLDDERVYDMICVPDTIGIFQIESRAQQQSLYQSQPRCFNDLIVQVAIIRPGPIQGDAVHPYLRRRQGLEPVTYLHPSLEPILAETRGVILYQEQILRIVMEVAGYTAGEADRFRRAMNRHRSRVEMESLGGEFVRRCMAHGGTDQATAELIFRAAAGFAQFGFCKSHAAAFARTAYETAWLRLEHCAAWLCSLLNAQPMGFYHPSVLVEDGKRHGVRTLPVDVTRSRGRCTLEWVAEVPPPAPAVAAGMAPGWRLDGDAVLPYPEARPATRAERDAARAVDLACRALGRTPAGDDRAALRELRRSGATLGGAESPWAVRLGFNYVAGLGPAGRAACEAAGQAGATGSVEEFWRHTLLPRAAMENLVMVGAFDGLTGDRSRRELLWELRRTEEALPPRRRRRAAAPSVAGTALPGAGTPPRGRGRVDTATLPERDPGADPSPPLVEVPADAPPLPAMDDRARTAAQYRVSELSTGPHLLAFLRDRLDALGCMPLPRVRDCANGARVRVAGLVIARQAPASAKGFRFFTLADEGAHLDLVFRPPVMDRCRDVANHHALLLVDGVLESEHGRVNLLVEEVRALDADGRVLEPRAARHGRNAAAAPRTQHGRAVGGFGEVPPAHDYR